MHNKHKKMFKALDFTALKNWFMIKICLILGNFIYDNIKVA